MKLLRIILAALFLGTGAACTADSTAGDTVEGRGGGPPAVPVTIATVAQKAMPIEIQVIGSVEPYSSVTIRSQITGQLISINLRTGDISHHEHEMLYSDRGL